MLKFHFNTNQIVNSEISGVNKIYVDIINFKALDCNS